MNADEAIALHGEAAVSQAARHALWRVGDLTWLLHEGVAPRNLGQTRAREMVLDAELRRVVAFVLEIGRRWGKSFFCIWWALTILLEIELRGGRGRVPYACGTYRSLREFILPIMRTVVATAPADMRPEVVGSEVRMPGGSTIPMQGCEDNHKADALRGPAANGAVVDEAGFIPVLKYVVEDVLSFQFATTGGMMLIASSPPRSPAHPFSEFASRAKEQGAYLHATIHDAPHVREEEKDRLAASFGGVQSTTWRREALAERIVDAEFAIIPEFSAPGAKDAIVLHVERPQYFDAYVIGDLGFVDHSFILFGYWHFDLAKIVIEGELARAGATSDVLHPLVRKIEGDLWGAQEPIARLLDATPRERAEMSKAPPAKEGEAQLPAVRFAGVNNQEREAAINKLRTDIDRRSVIIDPRCVRLIDQLENGLWNSTRTDFERTATFGHCDGVSAAMYFVRHVDRNRNPNPAPVYDVQKQWVPPTTRKPASGWASIGKRS